jgi:methane/ammonia monooxygenase subunit A
MGIIDIGVAKSAGLTREESEFYRKVWEWIVVVVVFLVLITAFHLHAMLTLGDWDFWVDWKDRRFWVTITPILGITFPAAVQYLTWEKFRLPLGATACCVSLVFGEWVVRAHGFYGWTYFPFSMIWPSTLIPGAIILDSVLLLSRNFLITGIIGGSLFGLVFYPANWIMLAPYHLPVENAGVLMSVADVIGFEYIRTGTPEYLRLIEAGTLRTFGTDVVPVSAFFSAFVCSLVYMVWWFVGKWFSKPLYVRPSAFGYGGEAEAPKAKA